jgi:hypothetical protein
MAPGPAAVAVAVSWPVVCRAVAAEVAVLVTGPGPDDVVAARAVAPPGETGPVPERAVARARNMTG